MKKFGVIYLFFGLFAISSYARKAAGQEVLDKTITLTVENARLKTVLHTIERKTDVHFVYSSGVIDADRTVSFSVRNKTLRQLLNQVFVPLDIHYNVLDGQIVLFGNSAPSATAIPSTPAPATTGIPISGKVTDESGAPLADATVQVKGTNLQTKTGSDGSFSFGEVDPAAVLVVSYVGFTSSETVVTTGPLAIRLYSADKNMTQAVVIGYGSSKKKDIVSAVDVVNLKDAGANTATSPAQLLQGRAAGVQVIQNSGQPGAGAQIIVRGTGSFSSVNPLYVIDGIIADQGLFESLSPLDIETITVLKDASSTAIYGAAAANGVILVTTKRAKSGSPKITYSSQVGMSNPWRRLSLLKAKDYVDLVKDIASATSTPLPAKFNTPGVLVDSTDWQNAVFQQGITTNNHLSITGGSDKVLYNFSTSYVTQGAIIKNFGTKRLNVRMGLDENLGHFHFGQNLSFQYINANGALANLIKAIMMPPYKSIKDPNVPGGYSIVSTADDLSSAINPLQRVGLSSQITNSFVFYPQLFGEVSLLKGLKWRSQFSAKLGGSKYNEFIQPFTGSNYISYDRQALENYSEYANYTLENYLNFARKFGRHDLNITVGNSYIDPGHYTQLDASGSNIPNDNVQNISVALSQAVTGTVNDYANPSLISYFGRLVYAFDDKYILSASVRRDGSSVFGPNNRFGNFPGLGLGWNFSRENFMRDRLPVLSEGKLRLGWGRTGNNSIAPFLTDATTFSGNPAGNLVYSLGTNETFVPGTTINRIPNPNLKWETTDQTDLGLDLGFLNNKLTLTVDLYKRLNKDLLVNVPLPTSVGVGGTAGVSSSLMMNAATAENKGIELTLGYANTIGKNFRLNLSANAALNKNRVISLGNHFMAPIRSGDFGYGAITYTAAGAPIGSFYGYRVDHVAKDQAEIDALNASAAKKTNGAVTVYQQGLLPGDFIFKDVNGRGYVNDSDQTVLGNPMPQVVYGFNAGLNYRNFDLNIGIAGVAGLKLVNATRAFTNYAGTANNASTDYLNRWRKPGDVAAYPRAGQDKGTNLLPSDFYLEDGSFLRLRNITLGYTIPQAAIPSVASNTLSSVRFYVASENLLTITKYKGFDPEVSTQGNDYIFNRGVDNGQYPQPRTFLLGIQVNFK